MYVQLVQYRPLSDPELAALLYAADFRTVPAAAGVGGIHSIWVVRKPDRSVVIMVEADSEGALLDADRAIVATTLLPAERGDILPAPETIDNCEVVRSFDLRPRPDGYGEVVPVPF